MAVRDAKARFSELLDVAIKKGPQVVTKRGVEAAVLVSIEEWRKLQQSARIEHWIDILESSFGVLSMNVTCFREWARLIQHKSDDLLEDAMIAATAKGARLGHRHQKRSRFCSLRRGLI